MPPLAMSLTSLYFPSGVVIGEVPSGAGVFARAMVTGPRRSQQLTLLRLADQPFQRLLQGALNRLQALILRGRGLQAREPLPRLAEPRA